MNFPVTTFEVRVKIKGASLGYHDYHGLYKYARVIKMFHFERRTKAQAIKEGKKHGDVLSCQKVKLEKIDNPEKYKLNQPDVYQLGNPYATPMAMDEMVWRKKKRDRRVNDLPKDKRYLTRE